MVLAVLWRRPWFLVLLVAADLAADGLSLVLRQWIGRLRPPLVYPDPRPLVSTPHTGAFPSGHSASAFACATVIAWASPRLAVPAFVLAAWSRGRASTSASTGRSMCSAAPLSACWSLQLF